MVIDLTYFTLHHTWGSNLLNFGVRYLSVSRSAGLDPRGSSPRRCTTGRGSRYLILRSLKWSDIRNLKQSPWFIGAALGIAASAATTSFVLIMKAVIGGPQEMGKSCQVPFLMIIPHPGGRINASRRERSGSARFAGLDGWCNISWKISCYRTFCGKPLDDGVPKILECLSNGM